MDFGINGTSSPSAAPTGQPLETTGAIQDPRATDRTRLLDRAYGKGLDGKGKGKDKEGDVFQLSPEAQKMVTELKARDAAVRAHEAAHVAAGGGVVAGGASFTYQTGPDGKRYAVGGEVPLDASPVKGNPRATETKARQIQAAALAPADPSPQDRKIAAMASQMAAQAASELAKEAAKKASEGGLGAGQNGDIKADGKPKSGQTGDLLDLTV